MRGIEDDLVVRVTDGHHRVHLLPVVRAEVDDHRAVVDRVGLLDRRLDLLGRVDPQAHAPHRLGPLHVVGQVGRQVHLAVALLVEELLPLAHHAEVGVVQDRHLDRDPLRARGHQLLRRHLEAPVAVDGPHEPFGLADLRADGRRHGEPHRAQTARVHVRIGMIELPPLRRPHLVLTHAGHDDRVVRRVVTQLVDAELRLERTVLELLVHEREVALPLVQPRVPFVERRPLPVGVTVLGLVVARSP